MNTQTPFVVISADRKEYTCELNANRRDMFEHQLNARELDYKRVEGFYQGETEVSYVVLIPEPGDEHNALRLARRYGQESALYVDANRHASLFLLNREDGGPDIREIVRVPGTWQELPAAQALTLEAFTRDGDRYYAVA
jgi:hypothetical protein